MTNFTAGFRSLTETDTVRFKLKAPVGEILEGYGLIFYDAPNELIRIASDCSAKIANFNPETLPSVDLPQEAVSQIQLTTDFLENPSIIIRLRKGKRSKWFTRFQTGTIKLPIRRRDIAAADKLVSRISLDILEDSLDEMLDFIDETLLSENSDRRKITLAKNLSDVRVPFHDLAFLDPEFAINYLLEATQEDRSKTRHDRETAEIIVKDLDYLAIALELFISYIDQNPDSPLDAYHKLWRSSKQTVMHWPNESLHDSFPLAVASIWYMTSRELTPDAQNTLNRLCWLAPAPIPLSLLTSAPSPAIEELTVYGLVNLDGPIEDSFTIHHLIQQVCRERIKIANRSQYISDTISLVDNFAPSSSENTHYRPTWNRLAPHIEALIKYCDSEAIAELPFRLMNELSDFYIQQKHYEKAELIIRRALTAKEQELGPQHLALTPFLDKLAILLEYSNRQKEASAVIKRSLEIVETELGFDHIDNARHLRKLGGFLYRCGKHHDAATILESALMIFESNPAANACEIDELNELLKPIADASEAEASEREDKNAVTVESILRVFRMSDDEGKRIFVGMEYQYGSQPTTLFAGIAKPGDAVRIKILDQNGNEVGRKETATDEDGNWIARIACKILESQKVIFEFTCPLFGVFKVAPYQTLAASYQIDDVLNTEHNETDNYITGSVIIANKL